MKPDISERIRKAKEAKEEKKSEEHERIMRIISARREEEETAEWKEKMQFGIFLAADMIVQKLEERRDMYAPKTKDEEWNPAFCESITLLPVASTFARNCWFRNIKED